MLGDHKFLSSPPPKQNEVSATQRSFLGDITNASVASVAGWFNTSKNAEKNCTNNIPIKANDTVDIESPTSKENALAACMALGDNGVNSPTRNALWNDDNAC